jgi:very-short-patch-repair endonuclease
MCDINNRKLCDNKDCNICLNKSFASHEKAKYWNNDKNEILPRQALKNSTKKFFFNCIVCLHIFDISLAQITNMNQFCQYCVNQRLCDDEKCEDCYNKSFAKNPSSKFWSKKNTLNPRDIFNKTHKKYLFDCEVCNHTFEKSVSGISSLTFCPYCSISSYILCDDNKCVMCHNKSFASHEKSKCWDYSKNDKTPREIFKNASSKYFFVCDVCKHSFDILPQSINGQEQFCPYCVNQKLCNNEDCNTCLDKSFAKNEFSQYWSSKNDVNARDIFYNTHKKYFFDCRKCGHELEIEISHIREDKLNCVYCGSKELCDDKNCKPCFNKSFASHEKSKYWSDKNKVVPRQVFKNTHDKYYFNCNICKSEFMIGLSNISCGGNWCSSCVNKTEKILYDWLCKKYEGKDIKTQFLIKQNDKKYFYDFHILELDLLIELDGLQHFKQVGKWKSPEHALVNDVNKINLAINHKKTIIHILQEDVYYNRNDWENKLTSCIKQYPTRSCVFIDNNQIYKAHIESVNKKINTIVI